MHHVFACAMPKWCALYLLVTKVFNCSISSPNHVKKQATTHILCLVLNESKAMFIKFLIQELSDDWNWVKLSSPPEMAMTPTPQQETRGEHPVRIEEHVTYPDWYDNNEHEWPSNLEDFGIMFWQTTVTGTVVFVSHVTHCRGVALSYIDVNLAFFDFRTAASIAPRKKFRIRCQGEPVSKPGGISDMLRRQSRDKLESLNHLKRCPEVRQFLFRKEEYWLADWQSGLHRCSNSIWFDDHETSETNWIRLPKLLKFSSLVSKSWLHSGTNGPSVETLTHLLTAASSLRSHGLTSIEAQGKNICTWSVTICFVYGATKWVLKEWCPRSLDKTENCPKKLSFWKGTSQLAMLSG